MGDNARSPLFRAPERKEFLSDAFNVQVTARSRTYPRGLCDAVSSRPDISHLLAEAANDDGTDSDASNWHRHSHRSRGSTGSARQQDRIAARGVRTRSLAPAK